MFESVLIVDDDTITLSLIEEILNGENYKIASFEDSAKALNSFLNKNYDLVISDFFMPGMNGDVFLKNIREHDQNTPFLMLTSNSKVDDVINALKSGADDYLFKPVVAADLLFRVRKCIDEKENKVLADKIRREKEVHELESRRLINWREMYASKEVKETENFIKLMTRNINQGGGAFTWLDLFKNNIKDIDEKYVKLSKNLVKIIINANELNKQFFDNITLLANLENYELKLERLKCSEFNEHVMDKICNYLSELCERNKRQFKIQYTTHSIGGSISIDIDIIRNIIEETVLNAIKYSPENSVIYFSVELGREQTGDALNIVVKSEPKKMSVKDDEGNNIFGIPAEYSELIFDLFYTMEPFPSYIPEEKWSNGTGLYIARKLLKLHNGWIKSATESDYSRGEAVNRIKFVMTLPIID